MRCGIGTCAWIIVMLSGLLLAASATATDAARWTIGHAAVQVNAGAPGQMHVKLSMRNQGRPDRTSVQLLGRWVPAAQVSRSIGARELPSFTLLGRYQREVAMKQTVIVTAPLRPPPSGSHVLELAVITGAAMTDQGRIPLHAP